jgi:hypothetical protein
MPDYGISLFSIAATKNLKLGKLKEKRFPQLTILEAESQRSGSPISQGGRHHTDGIHTEEEDIE